MRVAVSEQFLKMSGEDESFLGAACHIPLLCSETVVRGAVQVIDCEGLVVSVVSVSNIATGVMGSTSIGLVLVISFEVL